MWPCLQINVAQFINYFLYTVNSKENRLNILLPLIVWDLLLAVLWVYPVYRSINEPNGHRLHTTQRYQRLWKTCQANTTTTFDVLIQLLDLQLTWFNVPCDPAFIYKTIVQLWLLFRVKYHSGNESRETQILVMIL